MRTTLVVSVLLATASARADDLADETAQRVVDLKRVRLGPEQGVLGAIDVSSFKGRYQLETAAIRRLLPLVAALRRCVDAQRATAGEFHTRLDFTLEPSGKLKRFAVPADRFQQLQACLLPHTLALSFPRFTGQPLHELQLIVGSPGARLGPGRAASKPVAVYPIGSEEERRGYGMAVMWVFSPWAMGIDRCAELVDQTLGFGYRVWLTIPIARSGRPAGLTVEIKGKLASKAIDPFVACAAPFVRAMEVPAHAGPGSFSYRKGTSTAGWGIR
jgi:hypothetical protein